MPVSSGPGRPRTYCSPAHRRQAERRARAARNWAWADPALKVMVATDLEVVELEAVDLDIDAANRAMSRMR